MLVTRLLLPLCMLSAIIITACGKDATSTQPSATATPSPPSPAATHATPAATTPSATPTTTPPAGGACSFVGAWTGNYPPGPYPFSGTPFEFEMKSDGTGTTHSMRADSEFAWKVEGGAFSIHGTKVNKGGRFSCSKDEVGKWGFTFTPDCNSVTMRVQQDPCKGRAKQLENGLTMKRK